MIVASLFLAAAAPASAGAEDLAVQAIHNYGTCVVQHTPQGARAVLAMDYRSEEYRKRLRAYMKGHDYCIGMDASIGSNTLLMAGALAEALLKTDVRRDDLAARLAFDPQREVIDARSPSEAMALCTVMADPANVARIFESEPTTHDEVNALKPIGPSLTECLKKGTSMTLNKPGLRALLALAAWRIVTTPRMAAS